MNTIAPRLFGTPEYYLALAFGSVADMALRYNKRDKVVHRYTIGCDGRAIALTVPVSHRAGACTPEGLKWSDIEVSAHGRWWESHARTLATAYGATPFFEYYFPKFGRIFSEEQVGRAVTDLIAEVDSIMLAALSLDHIPTGATVNIRPYRQAVPCDAPALSALDLLFNAGPDAPLFLLEAD